MNEVRLKKPSKKKSRVRDDILKSKPGILTRIGLDQSVDLDKISGTVEVFDDNQLVLKIDKKQLANYIINQQRSDSTKGITKFFDNTKFSAEINYSSKGVLHITGDPSGVVFFFG